MQTQKKKEIYLPLCDGGHFQTLSIELRGRETRNNIFMPTPDNISKEGLKLLNADTKMLVHAVKRRRWVFNPACRIIVHTPPPSSASQLKHTNMHTKYEHRGLIQIR